MEEVEKKLATFPEHIRLALPNMFPKSYVESPLFINLLNNERRVYDLFKREGELHILATPLADIFSVNIFNDAVADGIPFQVYGSIQLTDGEGILFILYDRNDDMPETVCNGDPLTIIFDEDGPIIPSDVISLKVDLKARVENRVVDIADDSQIWDYDAINDFDRVKTSQFNGVQGRAVVEYIIYRHAVFTTLDVMLNKNENETSCKTANIYGSIVALYANHSTTIFDKDQSDPVAMEFGTYLELSRYVVAVPAWCSSFTIRAHLWNADTHEKIVDTSEKLGVTHWFSLERTLEGVQLFLEWKHAYMLPDIEQPSTNIEQPSTDHTLPDPKKFKYTYDQQSLPIYLGDSDPNEVLEVFSIAVCSSTDEELNLWGLIRFSGNPFQAFTLFDQDKEKPRRVVPNQTLSLTFPTKCIVYPGFGIKLDLKDIDDRVISLGVVSWDDETLKKPISWFNRPLCSVVEGENDYYAVVHYSVFSAAYQATVYISLIDKKSTMKDTKVGGCVLVQYSDYKYVTLYDKEFYRRKLFTETFESSSKKFVNSTIVLDRSVVAVPEKSSLIVDVNLKVISDMMEAPETFEKQLDFKPDMGNMMRQTIEATVHQIDVAVEWSEKVL